MNEDNLTSATCIAIAALFAAIAYYSPLFGIIPCALIAIWFAGAAIFGREQGE